MYREEIVRKLVGVQIVVVTPFDEDRDLDEVALRQHIRFLIDKGIRYGTGALVMFGSTGECAAMTLDERKKGLEVAIESAASEVPIIVGANESSTRMVIELVNHASSLGACAAQILPPYYMRPNYEAMKRHFKAISDATDLPIILYNNPDILNVDVPIDDLAQLGEIDHIVGIKECTWIMEKLRLVAANLSERFMVFNGNGEAQEPFGYLSGTVGFVSAIANFTPQLSLAVHEAGVAGDTKRGMKLYRVVQPWCKLLSAISARDGAGQAISLVKASMEILGWPSMNPRLPIYPLAAADKLILETVLRQMELEELAPIAKPAK